MKPESTTKTTVGGAPARLDALDCPAGGVFVLTAIVVRAGRAYVFVTYDQPAKEAAVRVGFGSLLEAISFDS